MVDWWSMRAVGRTCRTAPSNFRPLNAAISFSVSVEPAFSMPSASDMIVE